MPKLVARKPATRTVTAVVLGIDADTASDPATQDPCLYRNTHVYPYLAARGFVVDKCQGPVATRADVAPKAVQPGVVFITGSGHGATDTFYGHLFAPVYKTGAYPAPEPVGKVVHLMSCETAVELGPDLVRNGCTAFFGYQGDFLYPTAVKDVFFECDARIDQAFADGLTAAEVYAQVKARFDARADELYALETDLALTYWAALKLLLTRLRCPSFPAGPNNYGVETATLT